MSREAYLSSLLQFAEEGTFPELCVSERRIIQAEGFVERGEYPAAMGMLRRALFKEPHAADFPTDAARLHQLNSLWDLINRHYWLSFKRRANRNFKNIEWVARMSERIGRAGMIVHRCDQAKMVNMMDLERLQEVLEQPK